MINFVLRIVCNFIDHDYRQLEQNIFTCKRCGRKLKQKNISDYINNIKNNV